MCAVLNEIQAENVILKDELKQIAAAREATKRPRAGKNVTNLGTNIFTTKECLRQLEVAEAETARKKATGKGKASEVAEVAVVANPFILVA
jgi:hypothetical protein